MTGVDGPIERAGKRRFLLISLLVIVVDQWTKWWIERSIHLGSAREVVPRLFYISHVRNTGVAFGFFASPDSHTSSTLLVVAGLLALGAVVYGFARTASTARLGLAALALVAGGAIGNLLDRLASGAVTDFLAVYIGAYHFPDFNVADSAISVGLALLVVESFLPRSRAAERSATA